MSAPVVLGVIPARGGSRGIERKNIRPFLGRPLIHWTIDCAARCGALTRTVVSTDDDEIAEVARAAGGDVPFRRPAALAEATTPMAPVIAHAVEQLRALDGFSPDFVIILQPTSPGRQPSHIRAAIDLLATGLWDSVASVTRVPHNHVPQKLLHLGPDGLVGVTGTPLRRMVHRRQDLRECHALNSLIFSCRVGLLASSPPDLWGERVGALVTPARFTPDIDEPGDWEDAEALLAPYLLGQRVKE